MVLLIMIGAQLFSQFLSLSLLPRRLIEVIGGLVDYPYLIITLLLFIYFLMFMFIEGIAVIVMTVPVILPLINIMGYDPIWFGILICVMCTVGGLTPPVGMSVCGCRDYKSEYGGYFPPSNYVRCTCYGNRRRANDALPRNCNLVAK